MSDKNVISDKSTIVKSWVESYSDMMFNWAMQRLPSKELAEDLIQDTFISAFNAFDKFEGKSNVKTWLFSILKNKIADHFRASFKKPTVSGSEFLDNFFDENGSWKPNQRPSNWSVEEGHLLDNPEFSLVLNQCMKHLPEHYFATLQLKFLEEKKAEDICQELNITESNLWQKIHRAKIQLRKCLEEYWFKK